MPATRSGSKYGSASRGFPRRVAKSGVKKSWAAAQKKKRGVKKSPKKSPRKSYNRDARLSKRYSAAVDALCQCKKSPADKKYSPKVKPSHFGSPAQVRHNAAEFKIKVKGRADKKAIKKSTRFIEIQK